MSEFVEVKTVELVGPALDWCVCMVAAGAQYHDDYGRATLVMPGAAAMMDGLKRPGYAASVPDYSSDWALGGPLIDKYCSALNKSDTGWWAHAGDRLGEGDTALVTLCRAIVAAKLGDVVQVPAELVGDRQ